MNKSLNNNAKRNNAFLNNLNKFYIKIIIFNIIRKLKKN